MNKLRSLPKRVVGMLCGLNLHKFRQVIVSPSIQKETHQT